MINLINHKICELQIPGEEGFKMKVPTHLKHKPVFGIEGYNKMDGIYAGRGSDAPCLSIGLAQWNQRGSQDVSAKVWRNSGSEVNDYKDGSWSRMSEELPIHRNLDLTIFICEAMNMLKNGQFSRPITIQNETTEIRKISENEFVDEDSMILEQKLFTGFDGEMIHNRLSTLADVLKRLGY